MKNANRGCVITISRFLRFVIFVIAGSEAEHWIFITQIIMISEAMNTLQIHGTDGWGSHRIYLQGRISIDYMINSINSDYYLYLEVDTFCILKYRRYGKEYEIHWIYVGMIKISLFFPVLKIFLKEDFD